MHYGITDFQSEGDPNNLAISSVDGPRSAPTQPLAPALKRGELALP